MIVVDPEGLKLFAQGVLLKLGVGDRDSRIVADHLVLANLFGVDSHGIVRLPYYVKAIRSGKLNPCPDYKIIRESDGIVFIDGDSGLGQGVAMEVTERVIEKAESNGIGFGCAVNLGHVGMLTHYTLKVVESRMIGMAVANAPAVMAPLGGRRAFLGTNPVAIGFPFKENRHILFDSAMSISSRGKILLAWKRGEKIPPNWALDENGEPTTDPEKAIGGALLPDGVKGYALALMIDLFCGAVLGGKFGFDLPSDFSSQGGFSILAISVEGFRDYADYLKDIEAYLARLKSIPKMKEFDEIRVPGELKFKILEERKKKGIPLDEETLASLVDLSEEFGVELKLE